MDILTEKTTGAIKLYMTIQDVLELNWQKNPAPLGKRGGVYRVVERSTGSLLYIGQATSLSNRLAPSAHPVYDKSNHDIYIVFEQDHNERCKMEYDFIRIMKPKLNIRNGLAPTYTEDEMTEIYKSIFE